MGARTILRVTHHPNQPWVGFSLFNGDLNHRTGVFLSQHHHGDTVRSCAALPELDQETIKSHADLSEGVVFLSKN